LASAYQNDDYVPPEIRGKRVIRWRWDGIWELDQEPIGSEEADLRGTQDAVSAAELPNNYFELYKLALIADRISARRGIANSFFLAVNTGIIALLGSQDVLWYPAAAGIAMCITWRALLKSYRHLNVSIHVLPGAPAVE
jgi:hypothetical protein